MSKTLDGLMDLQSNYIKKIYLGNYHSCSIKELEIMLDLLNNEVAFRHKYHGYVDEEDLANFTQQLLWVKMDVEQVLIEKYKAKGIEWEY